MKKRFTFFIITSLAIFSIVGCNKKGNSSSLNSNSNNSLSSLTSFDSVTNSTSDITNGEKKMFEIHALELKKQYGDAILIKYGDYEILVDAGERDDYLTIRRCLDKYVTDRRLEMIINTHPHSDHVGGMTTAFPFTNIDSIDYIIDTGYNYGAHQDFQKNVIDKYVAKGTTHLTALEVINNKMMKDFKISDDLTLHFIDTGFYDKASTAKLNDTSIALYFEIGNTILYLGGDGESSCESSIMNKNPRFTKSSNQVIYKASHHGSNGANTKSFLSYIDPDYIFCSATLASVNSLPSFNVHPYYGAISRMASFTKEVYWNGINGTLHMQTDGYSKLEIVGEGRTLNYKYTDENNNVVDAPIEEEKNITYFNSKYYLEGVKNAGWNDYR